MALEKSDFNHTAVGELTVTSIAYISILSTILVMSFVIMCIKISSYGQKTRSTQQRRQYIGTRARPSLPQTDPTIYVSPANLPPPPKYEAMAPPSYEEVVGIHYPNYQPPQVQPITQPIAAAMANTTAAATASATTTATTTETGTTASPSAVLTITNERSATTASS